MQISVSAGQGIGARLNYLGSLELSWQRALLYRSAAVALVLWCAAFIYTVVEIIPNAIYWLSYYAANYDAGFVRRGLAGELIQVFPAHDYFIVARSLMALSVALYLAALLVLIRQVLNSGQRSERRVVVSLLIPVLPCAASFALMGPRPEFVAAGAFLLFIVALTRITDRRFIVLSSACYGLFIALMAFAHEAIAIEFVLGAVLSIEVLAHLDREVIRRWCIGLATVPGLIALGVIAVFGRKDLAPQICNSIPHKTMQNTFKVPPGKLMDYAEGRFQSVADYHNWVCRHIVPTFNQSVTQAMHTVWRHGLPLLAGGFIHGMLVCVLTIWLLVYFTGVPVREFLQNIRGGLLAPGIALALMIPIFATGLDWIRWWTLITINIVCVYLMFAADRPQIEEPISRKRLKVFIGVAIFFACVPLAGTAGYGAPFS